MPRNGVLRQIKTLELASLFVFVLGSGVIGYLCAMVHHTLNAVPGYGVDHAEMLKPFVVKVEPPAKRRLRVKPGAQAGQAQAVLTPEEGWRVLHTLWYVSLKEELKEARAVSHDATNTRQGLGTTLVATVLAPIVWMCVLASRWLRSAVWLMAVAFTLCGVAAVVWWLRPSWIAKVVEKVKMQQLKWVVRIAFVVAAVVAIAIALRRSDAFVMVAVALAALLTWLVATQYIRTRNHAEGLDRMLVATALQDHGAEIEVVVGNGDTILGSEPPPRGNLL